MLTLGKTLDRSYNIRIPFLTGFYNIGVFFKKNSPFLLFSADFDNFRSETSISGIKISMFKNLKGSKFVNTFLGLHNYKGEKLDIVDQMKNIKSEYSDHINLILNETITLSKYTIDEKDIFDCLVIYGFNFPMYSNEFLFLIAERQNVIKNLQKKFVRSTALQISTTKSLQFLDEFYNDSISFGKEGAKIIYHSNKPITL